MSALVLELQDLALSPQTGILELLRRARAVAVKLDLSDAETWIGHEINGYSTTAEVPPYRRIPSVLQAQSPFHGWRPFVWPAASPLNEHFSQVVITHPVPQIESQASKSGDVALTIGASERDLLVSLDEDLAQLLFARFCSRSSYVAILEGVRTKVLDWALMLEKQGVLGNGMTFDASERRAASQVAAPVPSWRLDLDGVVDDHIRQILTSTTRELSLVLSSNDLSMAGIVLAGSVGEGLLYDALLARKSDAEQARGAPRRNGRVTDLGRWNLADYIDVAAELGMLSPSTSRMAHSVLREFRNMIHPALQVRERLRPDVAELKASVAWLEAVARDLHVSHRPPVP